MHFAGRHSRQTRLAGVGSAGQARLASAHAVVNERGLAGWVMARYLAGAGVGTLSVADAQLEVAARAVDDRVCVLRVEPEACEPGVDVELDALEPAAREVARGARAAVRALGAILREGA